MPSIRVLVVEDSATIRALLAETIGAHPEFELVGLAEDGKEAIELCARVRPDVVSMDMMLPKMSGLAATEYVMAHCPTPILIVSSSANRGELFKTYEALSAGAVDVLEKPTGTEPEGAWERRYLSMLRIASRVRVVTHHHGRSEAARQAADPQPRLPAGDPIPRDLLAIGASTGGPSAIVHILRGLPVRFDLPVLLVLHLHEMFAPAFAEWLDGQTAIRAAYARDGDRLESHAGRVALAPPGTHMLLSDGRLRLTDMPQRHSCRPSIDVLFESIAAQRGLSAAGVLLTGMGRDGAEGLLKMRQAGARTIAQDEASSIVYGMPREAARLGAASQILPLDDIATALGALCLGALVR